LSYRHVARAQTNDVHRRSDGSVQTLVRGSRTQYLVRGYAKACQLAKASRDAETAELRRLLSSWAAVSEGQLRYELQLRRSTLQKNRMNAMQDCSPEALDAIARAFYARVGWDKPYAGEDRIRETLRASATTSRRRSGATSWSTSSRTRSVSIRRAEPPRTGRGTAGCPKASPARPDRIVDHTPARLRRGPARSTTDSSSRLSPPDERFPGTTTAGSLSR
jgi:hypothetical protein